MIILGMVGLSSVMWLYIAYLLATASVPPAWLVWPLLVELFFDLISVPAGVSLGKGWLAVWRACMTVVTISAILWVARNN